MSRSAQSFVGHFPAPWYGRSFSGRLSSNFAGVFENSDIIGRIARPEGITRRVFFDLLRP
jgi:hypothetical protein